MHYANGREAKAGDLVVLTGDKYAAPVTGILHSVSADSTTCNARLALVTPNDPHVTIGSCLHIDDVRAATIPDSSKA